MKKVFYLACLPVLLTASSTAELPENNRLMYNKHASGYVEVKFNRSTRFESLRTLKPERTFIQSIQTAYFSAGAWNIHSLPQKNDGVDHVPAGFNKLEKFEFRNPETTVIIRNRDFLITRKFSILKDSSIFKYTGEWKCLQENYLGNFFISFTPGKSFTKVFYYKQGKFHERDKESRYNMPQGEAMLYTDDSGKNGFIFLVDQSLYANQETGAFFRRNGVSLPGYCSRALKKGETIPLTVYFALFNDTDPEKALQAARKRIFGSETAKSLPRPLPRPVVTTGKILNTSAAGSFWRLGCELLPAESPLPRQKCSSWQISGAGNEFIAEQLVFTPSQKVKSFDMKLSDFIRKDGKKLSAGTFNIEYIRSIPRHSAGHSVAVAGEYSDRLLRKLPRQLLPRKHYGFLISGRIPAGTAPGIYQGRVTLKTDGSTHKLPLTLKIHNFSLPAQPAWYADFLIGSYADHFTKNKKAAAQFCKKDLVALRLQPAISVHVFFDKNGKLKNAPIWAVKQQFKLTGPQRFRIYGTFRCGKFPKLKHMSPEMDAAMAMFARVTQQAFKPAGLTDKVLWQIGDECHLLDKLKSQIHYSKLTGEAAPELRRFATINGFNPMIKELIRHTDILVPHSAILFKCIKGKIDLKGKEIWTYDNEFMCSGVRFSKVRAMAWKGFKYGISGYHQWNVNAWVKNWRPGDDYSGTIYYPPEEKIDTHPQRSMRLVNFALTVSDYDYLALLQKLIRENAGTPAAAAAAGKLTALVNGISPEWHFQTREYSKIETARERVAALIISLQK